MAGEIYVDDVGTALIIVIRDGANVVDLSTATVEIKLQKPDKSYLTKVGSLYTDGTDGTVQYIFEEGDLNQAGQWRFQAKAIFPSGRWHTNPGAFTVHENI